MLGVRPVIHNLLVASFGRTALGHDSRVNDTTTPGPIVYLPVHLDSEGTPADVRMIRLPDGRVALLGYTALDRLIACCGDHQPWLVFEVSRLEALRETKPFDLKYLDLELPDHLRVQATEAALS